jgi:hypothetical protein
MTGAMQAMYEALGCTNPEAGLLADLRKLNALFHNVNNFLGQNGADSTGTFILSYREILMITD